MDEKTLKFLQENKPLTKEQLKESWANQAIDFILQTQLRVKKLQELRVDIDFQFDMTKLSAIPLYKQFEKCDWQIEWDKDNMESLLENVDFSKFK